MTTKAAAWFYGQSFNGPRFPQPRYRVWSSLGFELLAEDDPHSIFETTDRAYAERVAAAASTSRIPCIVREVR